MLTALVLVCSLAAFSFVYVQWRGRGLVLSIILATLIIPFETIAIPLLLIVSKLPWIGADGLEIGWLNSYHVQIIPFIASPLYVYLFYTFFVGMPKELEEAAFVDGASRTVALTRVLLPLAAPGIVASAIFAFTLSWNEFLYALVFLASPQQKTIPIGVFTELVRGDVFYWGPLMAGALLGSIPVALVYSFFVEHYVTALTGAVKG